MSRVTRHVSRFTCHLPLPIVLRQPALVRLQHFHPGADQVTHVECSAGWPNQCARSEPAPARPGIPSSTSRSAMRTQGHTPGFIQPITCSAGPAEPLPVPGSGPLPPGGSPPGARPWPPAWSPDEAVGGVPVTSRCQGLSWAKAPSPRPQAPAGSTVPRGQLRRPGPNGGHGVGGMVAEGRLGDARSIGDAPDIGRRRAGIPAGKTSGSSPGRQLQRVGTATVP